MLCISVGTVIRMLKYYHHHPESMHVCACTRTCAGHALVASLILLNNCRQLGEGGRKLPRQVLCPLSTWCFSLKMNAALYVEMHQLL